MGFVSLRVLAAVAQELGYRAQTYEPRYPECSYFDLIDSIDYLHHGLILKRALLLFLGS